MNKYWINNVLLLGLVERQKRDALQKKPEEKTLQEQLAESETKLKEKEKLYNKFVKGEILPSVSFIRFQFFSLPLIYTHNEILTHFLLDSTINNIQSK
jgi:hypothetical protein